jgi:hypothetical protein
MLRIEARPGQAQDFASLQHGFAGIAETGTLMLPSHPTRPTTLNLLPDTAMVLLRTSRVVGAYEEAWDLLRAENSDSRTGGFMGLSFAVPIDIAMQVSKQLKASGRVQRGWIGVTIQDVTRELAESFGMKRPYGALIADVLPEGPAAKSSPT